MANLILSFLILSYSSCALATDASGTSVKTMSIIVEILSKSDETRYFNEGSYEDDIDMIELTQDARRTKASR